MDKNIKKVSNQFIKKHRITNVDYPTLKQIVDNMGFTVIEFNNILNDKDVETVVQNLGLEETILHSRGFTYADNNHRLVFVNEDLNDDEKLYVISHELGHIICEHFTRSPIIGMDVKEEYEANEFAHYLLEQDFSRNLTSVIRKRKKTVIVFSSILLAILILFVTLLAVNKEKSYYGDYYITATGAKYHEANCIHIKNKNNIRRLTKEQFESGEYGPCMVCIP